MQKKYLIIIAITIFAMVVFYWQDNYFGKGNMRPSLGSLTQEWNQVTENVPQNDFTNESTSPVSVVEENADGSAPHTPSEVNKLFGNVLREISICLQVKNNIDQAEVEPTLQNLLVSLQPALGESSVITDDWAQTDVRYTDGVTKRVRTEVSYDDPGNPTRYLQIYRMDENNIPELEDSDPLHSVNPTDDYIASLSVGGEVVLAEKGGRVYFQGGEEMAVVEQNGQLDSIALSKGNKTINCISLASTSSTCQCF